MSASTFELIWDRLKKEGKVKISLPQDLLETLEFPDLKRKFFQIRKHVSDRKAMDYKFRAKFPAARLVTAEESFKEGWLVLEIRYTSGSRLKIG